MTEERPSYEAAPSGEAPLRRFDVSSDMGGFCNAQQTGNGLWSRADEALAALSAKDAQLTELRSRLAGCESDRDELRKRFEEQLARAEAAEKERDRLRHIAILSASACGPEHEGADPAELIRSIETLRAERDALRAEREEGSEIVSELRADRDRLRAERDAIATDADPAGTIRENHRLTQDNTALRAKVDLLIKQDQRRDRELRDHRGLLASLRAERDLLTKELHRREHELRELRERIRRGDRFIAPISAERDRLHRIVVEAASAIAKLRAERDAARADLERAVFLRDDYAASVRRLERDEAEILAECERIEPKFRSAGTIPGELGGNAVVFLLRHLERERDEARAERTQQLYDKELGDLLPLIEPSPRRDVLDRIVQWTREHGPALQPIRADTYGEGMRDAKEQVAKIIADWCGGEQPRRDVLAELDRWLAEDRCRGASLGSALSGERTASLWGRGGKTESARRATAIEALGAVLSDWRDREPPANRSASELVIDEPVRPSPEIPPLEQLAEKQLNEWASKYAARQAAKAQAIRDGAEPMPIAGTFRVTFVGPCTITVQPEHRCGSFDNAGAEHAPKEEA